MKTLLKIKTALFVALAVLFIVPIPEYATETDAIVLFSVAALGTFLYFLSTAPTSSAHYNGVNVEVWVKYIIERFWKDNQFLKHAHNDDDYVVAGRIVHIPQPGAKPSVVKNRNSFPATAVRRTDTDITYTLDEYSTDPTHLPEVDKVHLSYSKMDNVFGDHVATLAETVADDILIKWATNATTIQRTSGAQVAPVTGQTANRLGFTHKDLQKVMTRMNVDNVPKNDRYVLIDDNMFEFFYDSLSDNAQKNFSEYVDAKEGVVGRLHGFNVLTRSSVLAAASNDTLKALGASLAATDNLVSLAWQKSAVARAMGDVKMFQDLNNPLYYGDIYSGLIRMGGRTRRSDNLGVVKIVQGTV